MKKGKEDMFIKVLTAILPAVITQIAKAIGESDTVSDIKNMFTAEEHAEDPLKKTTALGLSTERKATNYSAIPQQVLDAIEIIYMQWSVAHMYMGKKINQKELLHKINIKYNLNRSNTTIRQICKGEYKGARSN